MHCTDWNTIPYTAALAKQQKLFDKIIACKQVGTPTHNLETIVFCEHPHTYTLGKSGKPGNLLVNEDFLNKIGATFHHINRGGDITYHGPGQIVGYPILDLNNHPYLLRQYIENLEEAVIRTIADFGIVGERLKGATGVWIEPHTLQARKICAIGVQASHFVTMHGFALNVNTDLKYYTYINPCGFTDKGVTSIAQEVGRAVNIDLVKKRLKEHLMLLLDINKE